MSKRIPDAFIDEIISRADIVDVVGRRVSLKRAGANFKGLCPFHDEKTPSFTVSPAKSFYHCFGCGAHGTAIRFLMEYENMSFPEAVEALAEMLAIPMPERTPDPNQDSNDALYDVLGQADQIYRAALREHAGAIEYLKNRGIDGSTAARFGIGYAPDAWDTMLSTLGGQAAKTEKLLQAGLILRNDTGRQYDRFRDRIMFPIRDARGRVLGFGGRVLGEGEPKYLNSPETPVFHKGRSLYGVYEARQQGRRPDEVLVVEGYLDVASLAQHGIGPALATLGTATTADHVRQLTRIADRVVFCFDGDRAGRAAAWRALEAALPFGGGNVEIKFLLMAEGEDPDSLVVNHGAEAFNRLLRDALPLSRFLIDDLASRIDLANADGRAKFVNQAKPLLDRLPAGVYRELLLTELADTVGVAADRMAAMIEGSTPLVPAPNPTQRKGPVAAERKPTLIRKAIALVLHYPAIAHELAPVDGFEEVDEPGAELLRELLGFAASRPDIKTAHLVERFREDPAGQHLHRLIVNEPLDSQEAALGVLNDSLHRIVEAHRRRKTAATIRGRGPV